VTQLFWLQQKVVQNTKYEIMNIFIRSSREPQKKGKRPPRGSRPLVENHWLSVWGIEVEKEASKCDTFRVRHCLAFRKNPHLAVGQSHVAELRLLTNSVYSPTTV